jgi:hypothetical protein
MPYKDPEQEREKVRRHRRNNKPKYAARQKQYYIDNPGTYLRNVCKSRAKKLGLEFNLEPEDFIIPEYCPIFGVKLERGGKGYHENSPSVDRLDPNLGYVKGNISIISFRANRIKADANPEELRKIADWIDLQKEAA